MNTKTILALSLSVVFSLSCLKGPTGPQNPHSGITIKGKFGALPKVGRSLAKSAAISKCDSLDPSLVKSVIVFSSTNGYWMSNIVNDSFNISVDKSQPAALLFVGSSGNNLGYLSLGSGLESIPINMTDSGVSMIDLQTLVSSANLIVPGHNPIGTEIPMSTSDITAYVFSNGSLGSVVQQPDVDGDGVVDMVAGNFYRYTFRYAINGGNFGSNLTPTLANPIGINCWTFEVKITDAEMNYPDSVSFKGPLGSGIESASSSLTQPFGPPESRSYCAPFIKSPQIPPAGAYIVIYKTKTLTFNVLSQTEITQHLIIPVPTISLNSDSTIHSISWEYRLSDGSSTIDPRAVIQSFSVQISVTVPNQTQSVQSYSVYNLTPDVTEHVLTNQSIHWNTFAGLGLGYWDVFGNQIGVNYNVP